MLCKAYLDNCKLLWELEAVWVPCSNPRKNLRLGSAVWCVFTVRGFVIAFHSPMNWTFFLCHYSNCGRWEVKSSACDASNAWTGLMYSELGVTISRPNGNRCCVPWDMASLAQHDGCQAFTPWETSCCFSSLHSLHIRNNRSGNTSEIASPLSNFGKTKQI